ncbi:MAG: FAD-dependent oxidoreductase [Myxococcales bacterium]|nr:FAD-dependent oxidoreductase [Myxococcales bacterium]
MKIAVIGSGVSGLAAADALRERHDVHLFEAGDRLGGHAHTVEVEVDGRAVSVDTGFIVYNETTYPGFVALLRDLGIPTQPTEMSFGVVCERTGIEWAGRGLGSVLARPSNLLRREFREMLRDLPRFNREAASLLDSGDEKVSLEEWLIGRRFSQGFRDLYLRPIGAAIWSAAPGSFLDFPAATFARFLHNHQLLRTRGFLPWRTVTGGSREYIRAIARRLSGRIFLNHPVRAVKRVADGVLVLAPDGIPHRYDRVVLATHSDQSLQLLADPTPDEVRVLSAIRYQENEAILHTDERILPKSHRARASWNYRVTGETRPRAVVTYDMNRLQSIEGSSRLLVTLNADDRLDPSRILTREIYHHPVFDAAAITAQDRFDTIDGGGGVHFCGAYWRHGFHEDGYWSGLRAAQRIAGSD